MIVQFEVDGDALIGLAALNGSSGDSLKKLKDKIEKDEVLKVDLERIKEMDPDFNQAALAISGFALIQLGLEDSSK